MIPVSTGTHFLIPRQYSCHATHVSDVSCSTTNWVKGNYKVRPWRPTDAPETARIWKECLLDTGLANYGLNRLRSADFLQREVAGSLVRLHARKQQAAAYARSLRLEASSRLGLPVEDITLGNLEALKGYSAETQSLFEYYRQVPVVSPSLFEVLVRLRALL